MSERVEKSPEAWREALTPEQYRVTREAGTERAFTGCFFATKTPGTYRCVCCATPLFGSGAKYDSGSGWPSFFAPLPGAPVAEHRDQTHGMTRTEVRCGRCEAHLGHSFPDGPPPTGIRYCINSAALELVPDDGSAPVRG